METKTKVIICVVALGTAYGFGRWSAPEKVRTETKIVEVEKKTEQKDTEQARDTHRETTTTETTRPDGTKEKTTRVIEDTVAKKRTETQVTDDTTKSTTESKEVTYATAKVTISALAALNVTDLAKPPVYGLAVTKPILGPITVGAFGFSDGRVGMSLGLTF